ncbi:MAG: hypothetical protein K0S37_806, partial [Microbacterium sp.]|nr:hypothetical protein [Microbacterium sp.]
FHAMNTRDARDRYADYLQRSIAETLARTGRDRRGLSLSALYVGNDGE